MSGKKKKKNQAEQHQYCAKCGEPLQELSCQYCNGKGFVRRWLLFKNECSVCHGTGTSIRCPDEVLHILEDLRAARAASTSPRKINSQKGGMRSKANLLPDPKPIGSKPGNPNNLKPRLHQNFKPPNQPLSPHPGPWNAAYPNPWHPAHPRHPKPWDAAYPNPWHPAHPRHRPPHHPTPPGSKRR